MCKIVSHFAPGLPFIRRLLSARCVPGIATSLHSVETNPARRCALVWSLAPGHVLIVDMAKHPDNLDVANRGQNS